MSSFIFIFTGILTVFIIANLYIFSQLKDSITHLRKGISYTIYILYWLFVSLMPINFLVRGLGLNKGLSQFIYTVGTGWLVFTLYMTIILIIISLIKYIYKPLRYKFVIALLTTFIILTIGYYNYANPEITNIKIDLSSKYKKNKSMRIVGISDIHLGYSTDKIMLKRHVKEINFLNADAIIISGDLIDHDIQPVLDQKMYEEINNLQSKYGTYACLGNHEYIGGIKNSRRFINSTNIKLLIDKSITLPNGLQILGRDDKINKDRKEVDFLLLSRNPNMPMLILDHQPPHKLDELANVDADIQFSGHTHRGQIWPMNLIVDKIYELSHGYRKINDLHIYVSSGLGLWGPSFRIGTISEIVVFDIKY